MGSSAGTKTRPVIEVMSAVVVTLTIVGLVVGILFPGKITSAILPIATTLLYIHKRCQAQ